MPTDYTHLGPMTTLTVTGTRGQSGGGSASNPTSARSGFGDSLITPQQRAFIEAGRRAARGDRTALDAFMAPLATPNYTPMPRVDPGMSQYLDEIAERNRALQPKPPTPSGPLPEVLITAPKPVPIVPMILGGLAAIAYPTTTAPRRIDELQPDMQPVFPRPDGAVTADPVIGGFAEPLRDPRDDPYADPMPELVIVGQPTRDPGLSVAPDLVGFPAPRFQPAPFGTPSRQPRPATRPSPTGQPVAQPQPVGRPLPDLTPFGPPGAPAARPGNPPAPTRPRTTPAPPPSTFASPNPFTNPIPFPGVRELPRLAPAPPPNIVSADPCNCPPGGGKPKKKSDKPKREPRTVCRTGTYTQSRKGISYSPKRTFPCP